MASNHENSDISGLNNLLMASNKLNQSQMNQFLHQSYLIQKLPVYQTTGNLYNQNLQSPFPVENQMQFVPHPIYDNNTMMQIAEQLNQFGQYQNSLMQTPSPVKTSTPLRQSVQTVEPDFNMKFYNECIHSQFSTPKKIDDHKSLYNMQSLALEACDKASKVYQAHSKRPYFKKIDLLCDRLKQDLIKQDKAVLNINSHGVAWAIKDFIFVFNRIISGWIIMRDYYYCKSEGMDCVRDSIDPSFYQNFLEWQEATAKMTQSLVKSFENLHSRDRHNGNQKMSTSGGSKNSSPTASPSSSSSDVHHKLFGRLVAQNSEEAQLVGGYLKSALYKPLSPSEVQTESSAISQESPDIPDSTHGYESFKLFKEMLPDNAFIQRNGNPFPLYNRGAESTPSDYTFGQFHSRKSLEEQFENLNATGIEGIQRLSINEETADELSLSLLNNLETMKKFNGENGSSKLEEMINFF